MIFSAWIWNKLAEEHRPDGEGPLRAFESEARARTAGHENDAHLARGHRVGPDPGGSTLGHALAVGLRQPDPLHRKDVIGRRCRQTVSTHQVADQPVELTEVDRGHLRGQTPSLIIGQLGPPTQQMALSKSLQSLH